MQGLVLFKDSLSQWAPTKRSGMPNKNGNMLVVRSYPLLKLHVVLSKEFVESSVRLLVSRFLPLSASDLENWLSDPENWVNLEDKESDQWEYEIRVQFPSLLSFYN